MRICDYTFEGGGSTILEQSPFWTWEKPCLYWLVSVSLTCHCHLVAAYLNSRDSFLWGKLDPLENWILWNWSHRSQLCASMNDWCARWWNCKPIPSQCFLFPPHIVWLDLNNQTFRAFQNTHSYEGFYQSKISLRREGNWDIWAFSSLTLDCPTPALLVTQKSRGWWKGQEQRIVRSGLSVLRETLKN